MSLNVGFFFEEAKIEKTHRGPLERVKVFELL